MEHVSLAKQADVVMVAPASANVIGKIAHGIADDMLTTTIMACRCKKIIAPAMNTNMFRNPIVQDNLKILEKYGHADPENVYVLTELVGDELEIIDPYGGTLQAYGLCYETMRKTILKLVNLLNESEDNGTD